MYCQVDGNIREAEAMQPVDGSRLLWGEQSTDMIFVRNCGPLNIYAKKSVNCDKSEFVRKLRKCYKIT